MLVQKIMRRISRDARQHQAILAHRAQHGGKITFNNRPVAVPPGTILGIRHAIVSGGYESAERQLIARHVRSDVPVIELGGCLGLVSGCISDALNDDVPHIVVEANPALLDACRHNAATPRRRHQTRVVNNAIAYNTDVVRFHASSNAHISRLGDANAAGNIEVPAVTLGALLSEIATPAAYTLVCDIEGTEFDLFAHEADALQTCQLALVEVHPHIFESQARTFDQFMSHVANCGFKTIDHIDNVYAFARG